MSDAEAARFSGEDAKTVCGAALVRGVDGDGLLCAGEGTGLALGVDAGVS